METTLSLYNQTPIAVSSSTGTPIFQAFQAKSGWIYQLGMRQMEGLMIIEEIVEGCGCTLLSGIKVVNKETNELLLDIPIPRNTKYSRSYVVSLLKTNLLKLMEDAALQTGYEFDMSYAENMVNKMLRNCYYSKSMDATLNWMKTIGII
ncbi:MAG: hypothetical protein IJ650_07215 [Paludibacteraceae bacterium]|nr:hypothetical protein [Paludibacteraceae bacterium]